MTDKDAELWAISPDAPDYEISSLGNFRRRTAARSNASAGMIKAQFKSSSGYFRVCAHVNKKQKCLYVHRLVCRAFHGDRPSEKHEVAHNDGNKNNNHFANLRWATSLENKLDKHKHGTMLCGSIHPSSKLSEKQVVEIIKDTRPQPLIAAQYGVRQQTISKIKTRAIWKSLAEAY